MDANQPAAAAPLVTIAIACYNAEATLAGAIDSALAQDWPHIEVIVVDDGSTDGTAGIIARYAARDARVRAFPHAANRWYAAAINTAVAAARGEFVAIFDGDDVSRPHRVSAQVARLTAYERATGTKLVFCYSNREVVNLDGKRSGPVLAIGRAGPEPHGRSVADFLLWHDADPRFVWGHFGSCTLLARRQTLLEVGPLDEAFRRGAEWDLAVRLSLRGGHFIAVDDFLMTQRRTQPPRERADKLRVTRQIQTKHRGYLRSRGVYPAAIALTHARYHHDGKHPLRAFGYVALASLSSPLVVLPHELRRLNRRHALDLPALGHNAAFLFGLRALQGALRLVTLHFVVKALTKTQFGQYQFILSCVGILVITALPGLINAVAQSAARQQPGSFGRAVSLSFRGSLVGALVLAGLGAYHFWRHEPETAAGFAVAAALFPAVYGLALWRAMRIGAEDFSGLFMWDGITNIAIAVLTIVGVWQLPGTLLVPLVVMFAVQAAFNFIATRVAARAIPADAPAENGIIRYGVRTTAYAALDIVAREIDKVLVATVLSPASLAVFAAAERLPEVGKGVVQDVAAILTPRFAKRTRYTHALDGVLRASGIGIGALMVIAAFTILPWFVVLIYGEAYRPAIPYAQALMCSVAIGSASTFRYRYITSQPDEVGARAVGVSISATRIAASCILVPLFGLLGAVISTYIYRIALTVIIHRQLARRYLRSKADGS